MTNRTAIEWTQDTWNPIRGCSRVSEGCRNCYAEKIAARFSGPGLPYHKLAEMTPTGARWKGIARLEPDKLHDLNRHQKPRMIFVNSMSDLYHESLFFDDEIWKVWGVMAECRQHTFQILTKRAERMYQYSQHHQTVPLENVWLGVSVENKEALGRIEWLRQTPAKVRFLSLEPLLEDLGTINLEGISWVIVGAESGIHARPMDEDWVRSIRDQCQTSNVKFFYKQKLDTRGHKIGRPFLDGQQHAEFPS